MDKPKILVVDDETGYLDVLRQVLRKDFEVITACSLRQALAEMKRSIFDIALVDIRLGTENGIDLSKLLRDIDPQMAIILMTAGYENYRDPNLGFDDYLIKGSTEEHYPVIIKNAIYLKRMPRDMRIRRLELLRELLPECKDRIRKFYRRVAGSYKQGDVEKLVGTLTRDNKDISWVVYNLPEHEENYFTVGVASTIGCGRGCAFCLHGMQAVVRLLDWQEIVCQVLYGLDSFHAAGLFETPRRTKPCVNFTCEGEPFTNLENVMAAIQRLASIDELGFEFIITSVGIEKQLRVFLDHYADLPGVRQYWSVNFCDPVMRESMMPSIQGQDLGVNRDLYQEIAEKRGQRVTASFIVFPGMNDREEDVDSMVRLFGCGRPFDIKIQAYQSPTSYQRYKTATPRELERFRQRLSRAGLNCRIRAVIGSKEFAGCGSTVPEEIYG